MRADPRWGALVVAACANAAPPAVEHPKPPAPAPIVHHLNDPDLQPAPKKLLDIDWAHAKADSDESAIWLKWAPESENVITVRGWRRAAIRWRW